MAVISVVKHQVGMKVLTLMQVKMAKKKVGAVRFELTTFWTRTKRATRLRYAPIETGTKLTVFLPGVNLFPFIDPHCH